MQQLAGAARLLRLLAHLLRGLWIIRRHFAGYTVQRREQAIQTWAAQLIALTAIDLVVQGRPVSKGPVLLVANHISWLDIPLLQAAVRCRFVSKADVRHWPVVGFLASACGTLYIERESRRDAMRVVHHMAESLRAGDALAVFPEGTTSDGLSILHFHANLFQAAISADAPVQAVALSFLDRASGKTSLAPAYVGDDSLAGSIWRTLTAAPLVAVLAFGEPVHAQGRERRQWAQALRSEIEGLRAAALSGLANR
jgi:1-acyl-sn-glycerol-3-phosphate acyltransferase